MSTFIKRPDVEGINMLLVGVNDSTFKEDFTPYTNKLSENKDNFLTVYGNEPREAFFDEGEIQAIRGGIGGELLGDAPVEYSEQYDDEADEFYEGETTVDAGGIQEAYSLYDAINVSIATCIRRCENVKNPVNIIIMTDRGVDYGSNIGSSKVKDMITKARSWGWKISLLVDSAERDVTSVALELGVDTKHAYNFEDAEEAIEIAKTIV